MKATLRSFLLLVFFPIAFPSIASSLLIDPQPLVFLSGGISASLSHSLTVPIDVVKTRQQQDPRFKGQEDLIENTKTIVEEDGILKLFSGSLPTLTGYFLQGSLKYGFYDAFKPLTSHLTEENVVNLLIAAGLAELIGTTVLTPLEASRIKQVASSDLSFVEALSQPSFESLQPCLLKMLPYTMVQLSTYEVMRSSQVPQVPAALISAVLSSLASQPGDALLSYSTRDEGFSVFEGVKDLGLDGLFGGTKARLLQMVVIVSVQLLVNDSIRAALGLGVVGV
ncbi:hypothetical protein TrLO_g8690 [Triparma laevis f. longispina]|uniref:Uncharacterized protein n=1 Tax=Triparma laevis f. longispina TaxID=1714387 RepID=A0A9W6ZMP6_9STRA|nr:hypothetical protein TrLO_g8690 [Triparma laevis f. longispina]